jgi:hypothetical protein
MGKVLWNSWLVIHCTRYLTSGKILEVEGGSSRSHSLENSVWKRLLTCRETDKYFDFDFFHTHVCTPPLLSSSCLAAINLWPQSFWKTLVGSSLPSGLRPVSGTIHKGGSLDAASVLLVPSSPKIQSQSVQVCHHYLCPGMTLDLADCIIDPGDHLLKALGDGCSMARYLLSEAGGATRLCLLPVIQWKWPSSFC